jgi:hypothetical protein
MVRWWGTDGEILYNHDDRLPIREKFTDITPYIPVFNHWMSVAELSPPPPSPSITLAQAQAVKIDMINALSNSKRLAPFHYPVAAGDYSWPTDDATMLAATVPTTQNLVSKSNEIAGKLNSLSSQTTQLGADVGSVRTASNTNVDVHNTNASTLTGAAHATLVDSLSVTVASPGLGGSLQAQYALVMSITEPAVGTTNPVPSAVSSWVPVGSPTPVNVTATEAAAIINGISARNIGITATKNAKTNAVNALTTVAAVIAYDVTAGW